MNIQMQGIRRTIAMTGMLAGLLLGAGSVLAQAEGAPPPKPSPEARQKFEERCKADPQKCEEMKKHMAERKAACEKDPEGCKKKREEHRQQMKAKCDKDPQKCEEAKKRLEEKRAECQKDPAACKQEREAHRQKMEERCKADPQKCEEWKKNHPPRPDGPRPDGQPMEPPPPPRASN
jgi:hypothetical protein